MKHNIGTKDKLIRLILAFVLLLLVWFDQIPGGMTGQIVVLVIAFILALTSYLDYCPLYAVLKISTDKKDKD